jgi:hypothetical protein
MWCPDCQQDVHALPTTDQRGLCCPRCGQFLRTAEPEPTSDEIEAVAPPLGYDGWELDQQLDDIGRALGIAQGTDAQAESLYTRHTMRMDQPHSDPPVLHIQPTEKPAAQPAAEHSTKLGTLGWLSLALGTVGFICGGVLLGWSLASGRAELWSIGLPVALAGQIALLIGLALQLDRMWRDSRRSAEKLDKVEEQLHDLRTATTLLGASHGPASSAFYAHFAGGANPQLLLADLKGQLDLLAVKMAKQDS